MTCSIIMENRSSLVHFYGNCYLTKSPGTCTIKERLNLTSIPLPDFLHDDTIVDFKSEITQYQLHEFQCSLRTTNTSKIVI